MTLSSLGKNARRAARQRQQGESVKAVVNERVEVKKKKADGARRIVDAHSIDLVFDRRNLKHLRTVGQATRASGIQGSRDVHVPVRTCTKRKILLLRTNLLDPLSHLRLRYNIRVVADDDGRSREGSRAITTALDVVIIPG